MKIDISGLSDGVHYLNLLEKMSEDFILPFIIEDCIKINIRIDKNSHSVLLNIVAEGFIKLQCDRCLESFPFLFNTEFDLLYEYNYSHKEIRDIRKIEEYNSFDIRPDTKYLNITEPLRDYILLSIPMRRVPEEKNNICTYCNRNVSEILMPKKEKDVNPVWDKLKDFKKTNKN